MKHVLRNTIAVFCALSCSIAAWQYPATADSLPTQQLTGGQLPMSKDISLSVLNAVTSSDPDHAKINLAVNQDVKDALGNILVVKGAPAIAEITRSRRASVWTILFHSPPHLEIGNATVEAVDGQRIPILLGVPKRNNSLDYRQSYSINPKNLKVIDLLQSSPGFQKTLVTLQNPANQQTLNDIVKSLAHKNVRDINMGVLNSQSAQQLAATVCNNFDAPGTAALFTSQNAAIWQKLWQNYKDHKGDVASGVDPIELATFAAALGTAADEMASKLNAWIDRQNVVLPLGAQIASRVYSQDGKAYIIQQTDYDLTKGFPTNQGEPASESTAASGPWSFGYYPQTTSPNPASFKTLSTFVPTNNLLTWHVEGSTVPSAALNPNTSSYQPPSILTLTYPPQQIVLSPAPGVDSTSLWQYAVVRWTAPVSGNYDITATFIGADSKPTTSDVYVFVNESSVWSDNGSPVQIIGSGTASAKSFSKPSVALSQGDAVDFVVGPGQDHEASNDATALQAHVLRVFQSQPALVAAN